MLPGCCKVPEDLRGARSRFVFFAAGYIDYGFSVPWIERLEDAGLPAVAGQVESFEAIDSSSARLRTNRCSP
jgi:hypothetical protein